MSNGIGHVWAVNAEGGDEGRPNGVGPVWIENADQLGSKLPEPESGDTGKVLGVLNSDGDIGWVPDQGGMAQVQADWDQADPSEVSYIANKPTIPSGVQLVPAATSADENKVLTVDSLGVPGWAVIPSQPTGLFEAVYGQTTFADISQAITDKRIVYCKVDQGLAAARMAFLAYKSNVAAEFQYYRSLSAHSASAQTDEVYIYKVNADGWETTTRKAGVSVAAGTHMSQSYSNDTLTLNAAWPDVDQTYNASSTNAQSGTAVAGALATVDEVPAVTSSDDGKVLQATYSGGSGSYAWATPATVTVDQSYNASSANAQSGTAVAQAIAAIPSASYSAGNGIAISEQGAISAVGGTGITVTARSTVQKTLTAHTQDYVPWWTSTEQHTVTYVSLLDSSLVSDIQNGGIAVTLAYPFKQFAATEGNQYLDDWNNYRSSFKAYAAIVGLQTLTYSSGPTYWGSTANRLVLGEITSPWAYEAGLDGPGISANTVVNYDFANVNASLSTITLADVLANPGNYCLTVLFYDTHWNLNAFDDGQAPYTCTIVSSYVTGSGDYTTGSYTGMSPSAITVTNPVPAYAAGDAGKVLKVNAGATGVEWANAGGGSSNVEIITLSSSAAAALETFAAAVHTAYAAGKVVVAKLLNADSIFTMYLPMTKAYEGETNQYYFGGQAMYWNEGASAWQPEEYYIYVLKYGDHPCEAQFSKARPTALSWTPFQ